MVGHHRRLWKSTALAGLLFCCAALPTMGQGVAVGLRGGVNSSAQRHSAGIDTPSRTTYHAGGILGVGLTQTFGLPLEGIYSRKGIATESGVAEALELGYVQIPLLGVGIVPTAPSSPITPHFSVGPNLGFELSCKVADGTGGSVGCVEGGAATREFDLGVLVGVGLSVGKGSMAFLIDVGLDRGFTDISDSAGSSIRNRTFMASAGFLFPVR